MLLYRVTWVDPQWHQLDASAAFHPLYIAVDRQGLGRFDNPHLYAALYAAVTPEGAVGETFGNLARWPRHELEREKEGRPRCLVTLELADGVNVVDLDDPAVLLRQRLRPSDVVRRNRDRTREVANEIWRGQRDAGVRGLRWWSYWRPEWTVLVLWSLGFELPLFPDVSVVDVEPIRREMPAVQVAADVLPRELGA